MKKIWFYVAVSNPSNWLRNMQTQDLEALKRFALNHANETDGQEVSIWESPSPDRLSLEDQGVRKIYEITDLRGCRMTLNKWQQQAIDSAIGNLYDSLYRAQMCSPDWKSGNGETRDEVIAGYELAIARLRGEEGAL